MENMINSLAFIYPPDASTFAKDTDSTFTFITWVCIVFFVLIVGLMFYYMVKYRRKSEDEVTPHISHNLALEVTWSVVPIILVIYMFYVGYKAYDRMMDPAAILEEATDGKYIDLYVTGKQWSWDVTYPNGEVVNSTASLATDKEGNLKWGFKDVKKRLPLLDLSDTAKNGFNDAFKAKVDSVLADEELFNEKDLSDDDKKELVALKNELTALKSYKGDNLELDTKSLYKKYSTFSNYITVPLGIPVRLNMTSNDVIHSFAVPAFRIKKDVIMNRTSVIWFKATKPGLYIYTCNEMCGIDHGHMIGYLRVVPPDEYQRYLDSLVGPKDPWDEGKKLYAACSACHSLDGTGLPTKLGPTWKDLWGSERQLTDGSTVTVDEAYVRESILQPNAKKAKGYENGVMPPQPLSDTQIKQIIEFMKSPNQKPEKK